MMKWDAWSASMKEACKVGPVELWKEDAEKLYNEGKYILTNSAVYQICYSPNYDNGNYYGLRLDESVLYKPRGGYCRPGRFHALTAKEINNVLGFTLLNE